jgi:hypothetical protein
MLLRLRQLCLVAEKLEPVVEDLRTAFGIEVCHRDPGVGKFGLHNALLPIGNSFIEVVAPVEGGTAAERYLHRRHGDGGYMVINDTDDLDHWESHMKTLGVRIAAKLEIEEYCGLQLHPRDTGGALLEINQTGKGGPLEGAYHPAGREWQPYVHTDLVTAVVGAELQSDSPEALANSWGEILDRPVKLDDQGFSIELDNARLRFVPNQDSRGEGLGGIDLLVPDAEKVRERCRQQNLSLIDGGVMVGGVRFYLGTAD